MSEEVEMLQGKELPSEDVQIMAVDKKKFEMMDAFIKKYSEFEMYLKDMGLPLDAVFDQAVINFKQGMHWIKECIYMYNPENEKK